MENVKELYKTVEHNMKKRKTIFKTDFLLPKNNFFVGLGSVLNIAGSYFDYNYSKSADRSRSQSFSFRLGECW